MSDTDTEIINQMLDYMQNVLEVPHPVFGEMPICPFAQMARLRQRISCRIYRFNSTTDLTLSSELMGWIQEFSRSEDYEALWVIHPDPLAMSLEELQQFVAQVNQQTAAMGLVAFSGHPEETFNIQGVYTRREPYLNFTVQTYKKVKIASDLLLKTRYYENWSEENLQQIGWPRNDSYSDSHMT